MAERRTGPRCPVVLDADALQARALRYLDRFDASADQLRRVLHRGIRRAAPDAPTQARLEADVERIVERLSSAAIIDDRRYAESLASGQRRRGASGKAIAHKLRARGIADGTIVEALRTIDADTEAPDLAAARALVRRRRLGPFRPAPERVRNAKRDLAALARAGFSYEVARQALDAGPDEGDV